MWAGVMGVLRVAGNPCCMEGQLASSIAVERPRRLWPRAVPRPRVSARARRALPYAGAAVSYVIIGVFFTQFLMNWIVAFAWLLAWTWGLPAVVRRVRR